MWTIKRKETDVSEGIKFKMIKLKCVLLSGSQGEYTSGPFESNNKSTFARKILREWRCLSREYLVSYHFLGLLYAYFESWESVFPGSLHWLNGELHQRTSILIDILGCITKYQILDI